MHRMWRRIAAIGFLGVGSCGQSFAQDVHALDDRLGQIEREMNLLQRQVYRNEVGGAPAPVTQGEPETGTAALDSQVRMDQLESQMRTLTGQLEEAQYAASQLSSRLDKMQSDYELRFQALEGGGARSGATTAAAPPVAKPPPTPAQTAMMPPVSIAPQSAPASPPAAEPPPAPNDSAADTPAVGGMLQGGSSQEQYNYAFGLLRQRDLAGAETAFRAFLKGHPKDPLAPNAQYWLGETYFGRENYHAAAAAFAEGYQKYPQGPKAAESLLKLGISLGDDGKKADACASFLRLDRDFPGLSPVLKDRLAREKQRLGC